MTSINLPELALRANRLTADLAGHPRHSAHQPQTAHTSRRARRLIPRRRPTTEH
jgi:hypothetical protein